MLIAIVMMTMAVLPKNPNDVAARPTADSSVTATAALPSTSSSRKLRIRDRIGSGRLLRGTAHTVSIAFCSACPTPRPP